MMNLSEERILDFLDGRLATPDEEELLHTLSVSPERRQVLRAHMRLRELTSNLARQERFTVPENVTDQLFSRLEDAGFTPPSMPESMLANASRSQFATPFAAPLAGTAGAGIFATVLSSGWRFGMMGLVTASVMSFVLGAGAFYVFGSSLGLHTHSQELAALRHASPHGTASAMHAAASASLALTTNDLSDGNASNVNVSNVPSHHGIKAIMAGSEPLGNLPVADQRIGNQSIAPIDQIGPANGNFAQLPTSMNAIQGPSSADLASADNGPSIGLTAPREISYGLKKDKMEYLNGPASIIPNAIPEPYSIDRGTISIREGIGPSINGSGDPNHNYMPQMGTLTEFRIGWTMWNYVIWRASMGEMSAYENSSSIDPTSGIVTTSKVAHQISNTVIGLESGVTLDPLGVPIDALAGFLYTEGSTNSFIGRVSLMVHFEPWKLMEISAGMEGLFYNHSLNVPITPNSSIAPFVANVKQPLSELDGLVGPALEIGWHF
ncbi:MAG TPA: hypothetical protein VGM92_09940 [Candidatus Kapabacteria bacterium]|jgi:hypothetical protein